MNTKILRLIWQTALSHILTSFMAAKPPTHSIKRRSKSLLLYLVSKMRKRSYIQESDLQEKFIVGSGPGGQNLQKTASCVWLKHLPTGIEVKCQKSRSREENRRIAREIL